MFIESVLHMILADINPDRRKRHWRGIRFPLQLNQVCGSRSATRYSSQGAKANLGPLGGITYICVLQSEFIN